MLNKSNLNLLIFVMFTMIFCLAILKLHICTQMTILGYNIGELKNKETYLLEQQNLLKIELAKITSKETLIMMAIKSDQNETKSKNNTVALAN
mgnify:CR=1 FL=1